MGYLYHKEDGAVVQKLFEWVCLCSLKTSSQFNIGSLWFLSVSSSIWLLSATTLAVSFIVFKCSSHLQSFTHYLASSSARRHLLVSQLSSCLPATSTIWLLVLHLCRCIPRQKHLLSLVNAWYEWQFSIKLFCSFETDRFSPCLLRRI